MDIADMSTGNGRASTASASTSSTADADQPFSENPLAHHTGDEANSQDVESRTGLGWRLLRSVGRTLKAQWFIVGLGVAILLAYLTPFIGRRGGTIRSEYTINYGCVVLIFLLTGLSVKVAALKHALTAWKLLLLVQTISFGILPVVTFAVERLLALSAFFDPYVLIGLIVMACVPTTVSSCAVLTAAAGGNEVAAVLNSIVGNTLGVIISPLLVVAFMQQGSGSLDIGDTFLKLGVTVVLPMLVGELIQFFFPKPVAWLKAHVNFTIISQCALLLFVYSAFCDSFSNPLSMSASEVFALLAVVVGLHFAYLAITWGLMAVPWWRLNRGDRIAGLFAGSQKTMSMGLPLVNILFGQGSANVGFVTLPLLILHPFQLAVAGFLTARLKKWGSSEQAVPAVQEELRGLVMEPVSEGKVHDNPQEESLVH